MPSEWEPAGFIYAQVHVLMGEHPKVAVLSDHAFRVHVRGILYCANLLTDGDVPKAIAAGWGRRGVAELVSKRLWSSLGDHYCIHDYLDWNPSRAQVLARKGQRKTAGASRASSARRNSAGQFEPATDPAPAGEPLAENGPAKTQRLSSPPSPSLALPKNQDQDHPPTAANGKVETLEPGAKPNGLSDDQAHLLRSLFAMNPAWGGVHFSLVNKLNRKHGKAVVTNALQQLAAGDGIADDPAALLGSVCAVAGKVEVEVEVEEFESGFDGFDEAFVVVEA